MGKSKAVFICGECGDSFPKWYGQCPSCQTWNSITESHLPSIPTTSNRSSRPTVKKPLLTPDQVKVQSVDRVMTQISEVDRVLGGGLVPGSLILLAGPPGIGKSTLASQIGLNLARVGPVIYLAGEENPPQIKIRLSRLSQQIPDHFLFSQEIDVEQIVKLPSLTKSPPALIIIDSIQTIYAASLGSQPGSPAQIKQATFILQQLAKLSGIPIIIIGHVTKEGSIAGPKLLEHMVDTVIYFEGDTNHHYRILRAVKNRFGTTNEIGLFTMETSGLKPVDNPLNLFSSKLKKPIAGMAVGVVIEGQRPLLVEIQALVNQTSLNIPRRVAQGIPTNRLIMLSAIISRRLGLSLGSYDVFVNVTGGLSIKEPAADLAVALSIISAYQQKPLPAKLALFGEVGLLGEVRPVPMIKQRAQEAKRLGFNRALIEKPVLLKTLSQALFS